MRSVCQLFYVSSAALAHDDATIREVLQTARRNNRRHDVTGCLLFSGRHFAQVLEGSESVVVPLARRIAADPRHTNVRVVRKTHRPEREYGDWSMGYIHDLDLEDRLAALLGSPAQDPRDIAGIVARMKPDTVMGALR